jgi:hypothetical protein
MGRGKRRCRPQAPAERGLHPPRVSPASPRHLRLVEPAPLRVVDVALVYGSRRGAIGSHLQRKAAWAREASAIDHHVVVPGRVPGHTCARRRRELASVRLALPRGYRVTLGLGPLEAALRALRPEVVLLHGSFSATPRIVRVSHEVGAVVVAVRHERRPWSPAVRVLHPAIHTWTRRREAEVDAVISASAPFDDVLAGLEHLISAAPGRGGRRGPVAVATSR